jgi:hypothetical protein
MPPELSRCGKQPGDFVGRQVFPLPQFFIRSAPRSDFPVFDIWLLTAGLR